jgi:ABC-type sugar transport system substrate-binding protein
MRKPSTITAKRRAFMATTVVAMSLVLAACGSSASSESSSAAAPVGSAEASEAPAESGAASEAPSEASVIDQFLLVPAGATELEAKPGAIQTGPVTGSDLSLPYEGVFPLPEGPIGDPNKTYLFCYSQALIRHPWAIAQEESVRLEAARHPNVKVLYNNTDNDPLKQIQDLETCAAQNPDAYLIWPHSVDPLTPVVEKLYDSGAVVVGMERTVATDKYTNWIFLDNVNATRMLAEAAGAQLGGKGVIVETSGAVGSSPQILRNDGFVKALTAAYPDIKLITTPPTDYSRANGYEVALQFLQSPDGQTIDAWYVHSGEIAIGILKAMKELGREGIPVYTIDGSKPEVQLIQSGEITAIAPWTPLHGDVAFRLAVYDIEGKDAPKNVLLLQPPLITAENADAQLAAAWGTEE